MTIGIYQLKDSGGMVHCNNLTVPSIPSLFQNVDEVLSNVEDRTNLFYSIGKLKKGVDPTKRQFESQDCVPFDIDDADTERFEEYNRAIIAALNVEYSKTGIINSGNGLQYIVQTTKPVVKNSDDYKALKPAYNKLCEKINQNLSVLQLPGHADTSVWSKGRVMRVPNTINKKPDQEPKKARLLQAIIQPQEFILDEVRSITAPKVSSIPTRVNTIDKKAVLNGCEFLSWAKENPQELDYAMWFDMCAITWTIDPSGNLTHEYSKGYKDYDPDVVDTQLSYMDETRSNVTCEKIETTWGKCESCHHFCKVNHPTEIKSEGFITTKATGFRNVSSKGTLTTPNYEDLYSYYCKTHRYITLKQSLDIYTHHSGVWNRMEEVEIKNFALNNLVKSKENERSEFLKQVQTQHLTDAEFFEKAGSGKANFKNGVLDLETGQFRPHTINDGFRWQLEFDYDPDADCPIYKKTMETNFRGDQELIRLSQEVGGYIVSGCPPSFLQKFFVLYGDGSNGKTSYATAILQCVGASNYSTISLDRLGKEEGRANLVGKLVNYIDEIPQVKIKSDVLKHLATGAPIEYRSLYSNGMVERLPVKILISSNSLPRNNDTSHGIFRKICIIPFKHKVKEEEKIPLNELADMFKKEAAGIFNYFYDGYKRLKKNKEFTQSKEVSVTLEQFKVESDSVSEWAHTSVEKKEDAKQVSTQTAYDSYREWCINNGRKSKSKIAFCKSMSKLFSPPKVGKATNRKSMKVFKGIEIIDDFTGEVVNDPLF